MGPRPSLATLRGLSWCWGVLWRRRPLLAHETFEGAYHTGWTGPSKTTQAVGANALVQTMSNELLAGVLRGKGKDTTLLVVVDKLMNEAEERAPTSSQVRLDPPPPPRLRPPPHFRASW